MDTKTPRASLTTAIHAVEPIVDAYFAAGDFSDAATDAFQVAVAARLRVLGWTAKEYTDAVWSPDAN